MSIPKNDQTGFLTNDFFNKSQIEQDQFWSRLFGSQVFTLHSPSSLQSPKIFECSHSVVSNPLDSDTNILFFSKPFPVSCYFIINKASRAVKLSKNGMDGIPRNTGNGQADFSVGSIRGKNELGLFFVCFD